MRTHRPTPLYQSVHENLKCLASPIPKMIGRDSDHAPFRGGLSDKPPLKGACQSPESTCVQNLTILVSAVPEI